MRITSQVVAFDTPDLDAESTFWAALVGGTVDKDEDWHMVMVNGEPRLGFQLAPNHVAPQWPDGTQQQQLHLDIYVDDIRAAHDEALGLGAKLLKAADDLDADSGFQVYADPVGHPFCLCWE